MGHKQPCARDAANFESLLFTRMHLQDRGVGTGACRLLFVMRGRMSRLRGAAWGKQVTWVRVLLLSQQCVCRQMWVGAARICTGEICRAFVLGEAFWGKRAALAGNCAVVQLGAE